MRWENDLHDKPCFVNERNIQADSYVHACMCGR